MVLNKFLEIEAEIDAINKNIEMVRKIKEEQSMKHITVFVEKVLEDVILPEYSKIGDAGMDIRAVDDVVIFPQETVIVKTGLKVAIPEGYEIQVRPRSGLSFKTPLRVANAPGTIDSGYRDEVGVIITNTHNTEVFEIKKGDRIAQFVLSEVPVIGWKLVDGVSSIGINRLGGFGSSGVE